ncbi:archaemetzincin family Zn-dependent metalloprotease [Pyrobaculum sp. 3827-6]|uniref:archaemetzincin family Zn-dependent metalloprotease n=1 Tax=Pyrobaculum sp. 3827-6 TaxID=2983604 RepID=UPI0021DAB187|nr:archaemetzincin family Zn-dependent metalloprotease [Pyrobaculum sp. 3827-6]MCU7788711.1 archaemetzincin family Zn-dependent metalloprotease [Pyrobaculum sp. 3827-6]
MRPRLVVAAPPGVGPLAVPEFDVEWRTAEIPYTKFIEPARGQCRADKLVAALSSGVAEPTVYVVDCDGYYPGLNFVFGLAAPALKTAVVFTARLRGPRFEERLVKEITHEAGHLYGLGHCQNPRCVMHFSNSLLDTDYKLPYFCDTCRRRLLRSL